MTRKFWEMFRIGIQFSKSADLVLIERGTAARAASRMRSAWVKKPGSWQQNREEFFIFDGKALRSAGCGTKSAGGGGCREEIVL
jgi:hypothetical protein